MTQETKVKAWVHTQGGYPAALQQSTISLPTAPLRPTELLIRVKAAGLNPVDVQLMSFPLTPYLPTFVVPTLKGMGEDFSGTVENAGPSSGFKPGDQVFGIVDFLEGTLQEVIRLDVTKAVVLPKPENWSWVQAAALPLVWLTAATTIAAIENYVKGGRVAILGGSSASGMYAVYMAKQRGWTVTASCSTTKSDFVSSMGADETIDYTSTDVPAELRKFGPDAIIDCVGGTDAIGIAKRYVTIVGDKTSRYAMGGTLTYVAYPRMVVRKTLSLFGFCPSYACLNLQFKKAYLEKVLELPEEKIIIDSVYEFGQVKEAYDHLAAGRAKGKVVVTVA